MDPSILGGADDALGGVGFRAGKALVHAGHHDVEFSEQVIVKIQPAARQDVDFTAREQAEFGAFIGERLIDGGDRLELFAQAFRIEAISSVELNRPYSLRRNPRWMARWRMTMLCSLLPVK
jgi:hypothetical protein